jgi:hypothetical protein
MLKRARLLTAAACVAALWCVNAEGQTVSAPGQTARGLQAGQAAQEQQPPAVVSSDTSATVASEIALLRKAVVSLSARLREITTKLFEADAGGAGRGDAGGAAGGKQGPLAQNLQILTLAEQRAEVMRRQLLEMIEKETAYRNRLVQLDEDARPENIDRNLTLVGTTRSTTDLRDLRRRVLDNERKGFENLLNQTAASRSRLEEDLKQADLLVARIRLKLLPLIEKEIDKLSPAPE